ncbi:Transcriptional adapter 3 [Camelus dromedarius]|nr:Transcriptional adapter 3 [Camelus dromedarius]
MVQPGLRLGTILGQGEAEEPFVPSGSAPPSFLRAPPTCCPPGSAGLSARPRTRPPSPAPRRPDCPLGYARGILSLSHLQRARSLPALSPPPTPSKTQGLALISSRPRVNCRGPAHSQFRGGCSHRPEHPAPSRGRGSVQGRKEEVEGVGAAALNWALDGHHLLILRTSQGASQGPLSWAMSELKDCPLQFHDFKSVDHLKVCPRYTAVLARSEDDGIGIEELDTLQLELETLLSSASRRLRVLEAETQILTDWQDKKGDRRFLKLGRDHELGAPPKHGKPKKQKLEGKAGHGPGPGPGRPKSKNLQPKIQEYEFTDDPIDVPRIPKNDAPNRFWASVEPYCADITSEEVRTLEELLKPPEDEAEHYKIPPLGKHYSQRWAQEDLLEEQKDGARAAAVADKKKGLMGPLTELDTKDVDALLKKSEAQHEQPEDGCPFGALTQRLLQALVEENIISPMEDSPIPDMSGKESGADGASTSPRNQNKPFSVPHTKSLESRIKEELIAQGLLESEDRPAEDSEDEVLAELRKRQAELKALSAHNRTKKHDLLRLAKEEVSRQELRQRVRMADNEVMDAFRKIMAARQKKRTPTKKEKDQAWKTLKERESILKLLDG